VAGHKGLDRPIRWAHIVDIPDVAPWVREGNLLLTTAFALRDNPDAQLELIPSLVKKGLSGMVVAVGRYFHEIPSQMIELANQLDFPIITLPFEVPFVEVTRAIHERILSEQYALLQQSHHIHKVLTHLVLEGKGLDALAESLARLLNRSVTIEDPGLRLLASASAGPEDEIRKRSIAERRTPAELVTYLASQGLFERLRKDPRPQHVPPVPELGMTLERIVAPILVGAQLYGYVWIIATDSPLAELDFLAIERAATVAALIMSREQAVYEAEQRLKASLLNNLLDPDPYHAIQDLSDTLRRLGLHQGYQVLVLEETSQEPTGSGYLCAFIEERIRLRGLKATVVERGQRLIVLLGNPDPRQGLDVANTLVEEGARQGFALIIGLSTASRQATRVRQCYQEAMEALRIGRALSEGQPGVWAFDDLGILPWLRALPPEVQSASRYHRVVEEIAKQDRERGTELLKTLEVYLDHLGNAQQAARDLFIHRNTLRQRLGKIEETWELDLKNPHTLLNLLLAIKDWRLNRGA
jgi:purine catabolism regulator